MKGTIVLVVTLLVAAAGCGRKEQARVEPAPVVTGVRVEVLTPTTGSEEYEAPGTVRSKAVTVLSSKVVGTVTEVRVREGERVRPGQVLVVIDSREAESQVARANAGRREAEEALTEVERAIQGAEASVVAAEAQKELAHSTFQRYQALLERQSVSRQEFEEVQAKLKASTAQADGAVAGRDAVRAKRNQVLARMDQAKAEIGTAETFAGYSRIRSPMAGLVAEKRVEPGNLAAPGVPLLTIEDDRSYRLEASVEESQLRHIRRGMPVSVRIEALGDEALAARVDEVTPGADPASRSFVVKASLPAGRGLRSGLFGRAVFRTGERRILAVPTRAVVERGQLSGVYVIDRNGTARLRLIRTGKAFGPSVEVLSGLTEGERVAVDGIERLVEGARVP
ncbi:MAG: efflux RND transporter periplasmic adaptor subunit [Deltaproteobacteria bacterium]|nr:efflux RND transporter periplasmic adaptor subunit [Deltaproteobacteria bacterium]